MDNPGVIPDECYSLVKESLLVDGYVYHFRRVPAEWLNEQTVTVAILTGACYYGSDNSVLIYYNNENREKIMEFARKKYLEDKDRITRQCYKSFAVEWGDGRG